MKIIKNAEYLDSDVGVEDKPALVYERKEYNEIKEKIENYFKNGSSFSHLINGASGCGKTLTVLYALYNFLQENPEFATDFIYIDGNRWKTPKSMFDYMVKKLGQKVIFQKQIPYFIDKIESSLNANKRRTLVIIDEIDKIYKNSRESPKYSFIHSLIRLKIKPRHAILMMTNDFNFIKRLDSEVSASLIETIFESYNVKDLIEILKKRAEYCLEKEACGLHDLAKIAKEIYDNPRGGDKTNARNAINLLGLCAQEADKKHKPITDVIDTCIDKMKINDYVKLLKKYNPHIQILIKTIAQLKLSLSRGIYKFTNVEIEYSTIKTDFFTALDEEDKKITERQFQNYLEQLVREGIIQRINKARYVLLEGSEEIIEAMEFIEKELK